jgi:hypothetical protein
MLCYAATASKLLRDSVRRDFLVSAICLLFLLLAILITTALSRTGLLAADTARATTTERRGESKVNVLLGVETDNVGRNVDDLLADTVKRC